MSALLASASSGEAMFVFVALFAIVACIVISASSARPQTEEDVRALARSLRGVVLPASVFEPSTIRLEIRGQPAWMTFSEGRDPMTKLRVRLPQFTEGRLRIVPDNTTRTFLECLGERYYKVGHGLFDAQFRVEANPRSLVRRVFSPDRLPEVVETVRRLHRCHGFSLLLEPGWLEIRVCEILRDIPVVLGMERTASEFVGYLLGVGDPGMQWGEIVERPAGLCPICTTVLREPLIRCGRCRAPHHQECWQYLGRCAVYGCEPRPGRRAA